MSLKVCPLCGCENYENHDPMTRCIRCGTDLKPVKLEMSIPNRGFVYETNTNPEIVSEKQSLTPGYILNTIYPALNKMISDAASYNCIMEIVYGSKPQKVSAIRSVFQFIISIPVNIFRLIGKILTFCAYTLMYCIGYTLLLSFGFIVLNGTLYSFADLNLAAPEYMEATRFFIIVLFLYLVGRALRRKFGFFSGPSFHHRWVMRQIEAEEEQCRQKNEAERAEIAITEAERVKQESLALIPGFDDKYWNYHDLNNLLEAFTSYKASSWADAYRYARKHR